MRPIDAEKFCTFLRDISTRQRYEELLCSKDKYPTVADVIEAVCCELDGTGLAGYNNAPTVELQMGRMTNGFIIPIARPKGEWIYERPNGKTYSDFVYCSNCHKSGGFYKTNFCPNCGADMRGDHHED